MTMYQVINVEQHGRQEWSKHRTEELARAAARKYARKNPGSHYGFEIRQDDRVIAQGARAEDF